MIRVSDVIPTWQMEVLRAMSKSRDLFVERGSRDFPAKAAPG